MLIRDLASYKFTGKDKNLIVFSSFGGHYSDGPKAVYEEFVKRNTGLRAVWLLDPQYTADIPRDLDWADIRSPEGKKLTDRAMYYVDNVYGPYTYQTEPSVISRVKGLIFAFFIRTPQRIYTTWHGTPLKKLGRDQIGNEYRDIKIGRVTMFNGNMYTQRIMEHVTFGNARMEMTGMPRNDALLLADSAGLKKKLGLPMDKKVILFAPTFRNDGKDKEDKNVDRSGLDQMKQMDPDRLFDTLSRRFGGDWVLVCRFHYHVEKMMDWDALGNRWAGRVINGNLHQDMADYLACADVLLTDASSCMFDFALTGRPCFLLFPDLAHYRDRERGFYTDIEALPYECCTDFSGLLSAIERFEGESYRRGIEKMMREFGFSEDGHAAKRVVDYILKDMAKK